MHRSWRRRISASGRGSSHQQPNERGRAQENVPAATKLPSISMKPFARHPILCAAILSLCITCFPGAGRAARGAEEAGRRTVDRKMHYGSTRDKDRATFLNAGPIRLKFIDGELRYLYVGDKEIVRRIYF